MPKVLVQNEALEVELEKNQNLRLGLKQKNISVYGSTISKVLNCRGKGMCGTCKVLVIEGRDSLSVPTNAEKKRLGQDKLETGYRLSCQCVATEDCEIHTNP